MGFALSDMQLSSTAFNNNEAIPRQYTGEGEDFSPALQWHGAPEGTRSYAIVCHDPDAPLVTKSGNYGFVHWVYYNIPGTVTSIDENCSSYTAGTNNFGNRAYGGPMPPEGHGQHNYYFWILALDSDTKLEEGLSMNQLLSKAEANIIGMNRLIGSYHRD